MRALQRREGAGGGRITIFGGRATGARAQAIASGRTVAPTTGVAAAAAAVDHNSRIRPDGQTGCVARPSLLRCTKRGDRRADRIEKQAEGRETLSVCESVPTTGGGDFNDATSIHRCRIKCKLEP